MTAEGVMIDVIQEEVTEIEMIDIVGIKTHVTTTDPLSVAAIATEMMTAMTTADEKAETTTDETIVTIAVDNPMTATVTATDPEIEKTPTETDETPIEIEMKGLASMANGLKQAILEMTTIHKKKANHPIKKKNKFNQGNS